MLCVGEEFDKLSVEGTPDRFSNASFHAFCRGTHGYMAPEVLSKGTAYDSSADWFSFGCMLYKLLKGHSPFRQHKTKDKHEIDRMTLTMVRLALYYFFPFLVCVSLFFTDAESTSPIGGVAFTARVLRPVSQSVVSLSVASCS